MGGGRAGSCRSHLEALRGHVWKDTYPEGLPHTEGLFLQNGALLGKISLETQELPPAPTLQLLGLSGEGREEHGHVVKDLGRRCFACWVSWSLGVTESWATSRLTNLIFSGKETEAIEDHAGPKFTVLLTSVCLFTPCEAPVMQYGQCFFARTLPPTTTVAPPSSVWEACDWATDCRPSAPHGEEDKGGVQPSSCHPGPATPRGAAAGDHQVTPNL